MKLFLISILLVLNAKAKGCDQATYDMVYKNILVQAIESDLSKENIDTRNETIELLRRLCNGQYSTYETGAKNTGGK